MPVASFRALVPAGLPFGSGKRTTTFASSALPPVTERATGAAHRRDAEYEEK